MTAAQTRPRRRTVLARTATALLAAFAGLAVLVRAGGEVPGDGVLAGPLVEGGPRSVALVVDVLTGYRGITGLTVLVVLSLLGLGRRRAAVLCGASVAGTMVGTTLCKQLVGRPRPASLPPDVEVSALSFPSGHAAATAALVLAVVLAVRRTRAVVPVAVLGALLTLAAAAVQLVLGLHRPSDLVAGWLWAAAWTSGVWAAADRRPAV